MSVATSTAIGIGAAVSAGTAIYGAHEASSASKTAASQQEQASQDALNFEKQAYATQQGELAPYRDAGLVGLNHLETLAGQPYQMTPGAMGWVGLNSLTPPASAPGSANFSAAMPGMLAAGAAAAPMTTGGGTGTPAAGTGGMVMVQAPTGETRVMPQAQAAAFVARGARIVPFVPQTGLASLGGGGRL